MKLKHVDEASTCELCGKVFRSGFHLSEHKKKVHNKMPCTICGKMFGTKHKMKIHMLAVHTKDHLKPYVCNVCHKGKKNYYLSLVGVKIRILKVNFKTGGTCCWVGQ